MPSARLVLTAGLAVLLASPLAIRGATPAAPADQVVINPGVRHQTMRGWGASLSFLRDLNFVSQPTVDQMVDESVNDLGLTFLRIGFALLAEPFNDNGSANSINWAGFGDTATVDREVARGLGRFAALVRANGEPPSFLLDKDWENSAPPWMTDAEFSEHVTANLLYYRNQHGIDINFNSIDNEPNHFDPYTPERQRSIIKVMGPMFQANGLSAKIALAEGIDAASTWTYITAMRDDAAVWPHIGLLNWHLYGTNDPYRSQIRDFGIARGIPTGMTEFGGAQVQTLMDDLTLGGVSYWTRYHIADRSAGAAGAGSNYFAAPFDGTSFLKNQTYYQFRQFMHYVRPGAVRIDAASSNASLRAFAFERAGTRVVVLVNTSSQAIDVTVQGLAPGRHGVSQTVGTAYSELGAQNVGTSMAVTVAGNGILTIYPASGNQPPVATTWAANPGFVTLPASTVALSASAQDPDRDALTYTWSVKSAPSGANVALGSASSTSTTATGLTAAGTYVFTIGIRDAAGNTVTRDVTVRAYQGNQAPVIAEGHRYYKQEWIVPPATSATYGPLFISAFDLEGDPVTTSFSVVRQPDGANARFSGATVSGLTVPGDYTFRFTASDPTHSVSRDFVRRVVSSAPSTPGAPPGAGPGRRRPVSAEPTGYAIPRTPPATSASPPVKRPAASRVQTSARAADTAAATGSMRPAMAPAWLPRLLEHPGDIGDAAGLDPGWRYVELVDTDDDGLVDVVRIALQSGAVWTWTIVRGNV